jgi:hypothetical protein
MKLGWFDKVDLWAGSKLRLDILQNAPEMPKMLLTVTDVIDLIGCAPLDNQVNGPSNIFNMNVVSEIKTVAIEIDIPSGLHLIHHPLKRILAFGSFLVSWADHTSQTQNPPFQPVGRTVADKKLLGTPFGNGVKPSGITIVSFLYIITFRISTIDKPT